jgi:hypothetical protein
MNMFERLKEIRIKASSSLEKSKQIGLTNPDLYGSELRRNSLSKQIKLAKMREAEEKLKYGVVRKKISL